MLPLALLLTVVVSFFPTQAGTASCNAQPRSVQAGATTGVLSDARGGPRPAHGRAPPLPPPPSPSPCVVEAVARGQRHRRSRQVVLAPTPRRRGVRRLCGVAARGVVPAPHRLHHQPDTPPPSLDAGGPRSVAAVAAVARWPPTATVARQAPTTRGSTQGATTTARSTARAMAAAAAGGVVPAGATASAVAGRRCGERPAKSSLACTRMRRCCGRFVLVACHQWIPPPHH